MCGICGSLQFKRAGRDKAAVVERMKQCLVRRGPDSNGLYHQGGLCLGHQRLSIIDLSAAGHQPMVDERWALVFNGCIYNYRALRQILQQLGSVFQGDSDTEVILRAWQQWGVESLQRLDGMFAFALYNPNEDALYLCRDRFGIKPLYYSLDTQRLHFASSIEAVLAAGDVNKDLNPQAFQFAFSLHAVVPAPHTVFKQVCKVPPAHYMRINKHGDSHTQRYWQLSVEQQGDAVQWQERIEKTLYKAVEKRLLAADVPVGVLLSGGVDSSLIVALAHQVRQKNPDIKPLQTFSIGFEDIGSERGSEFYYSDQVVEQFATQHHKMVVPNAAVLQRLPEAIAAMSEPMFGQDAVAFYLLSEQVAQHVKVVLSGQGADEVFGGYFWYPQMQQAAQGVHGDVSHFDPYYCDRTWQEMQQALSPDFVKSDVVRPWIDEQLRGEGDFINRVLSFDATTLIVDDPVKRVDNMTMAFSLEARVPFLDTAVVEQAMRSSGQWRLQNGGKHPLKQMALAHFNHDFVFRKKGYFPMPALKQVQGAFKDWMHDILHAQACRERGIYNRRFVEKLLADPQHPDHFTRLQGSKLWHFAVFEAWLQNHT